MDQTRPDLNAGAINPVAAPPPLTPETPQPLGTGSELQMGMSIGSSVAGASGTPPIVPPPAGQGLPPELPHVDQENKSGGKKMMMIGVIVILLLLLGGAGYYYYSTMTGTPVEEVVETQSVPDSELTNLQTEIDQIEVADPEADLAGIDEEIKLIEATPSAR